MGLINTTLYIIALALLAVGFVNTGMSVYDNIDAETQSALFDSLRADPLGNGLKGFLFLQFYQLVTPAYEVDWLPSFIHPKGETLFMVEEFPLPDSRIIFPLFFVWLATAQAAKMIWNSDLSFFASVGYITLLFLVVTIIAVILINIISYILMIELGQSIGLEKDVINTIRADEYERLDATVGIKESIVLSILFGVFYIQGLLKGQNDD